MNTLGEELWKSVKGPDFRFMFLDILCLVLLTGAGQMFRFIFHKRAPLFPRNPRQQTQLLPNLPPSPLQVPVSVQDVIKLTLNFCTWWSAFQAWWLT